MTYRALAGWPGGPIEGHLFLRSDFVERIAYCARSSGLEAGEYRTKGYLMRRYGKLLYSSGSKNLHFWSVHFLTRAMVIGVTPAATRRSTIKNNVGKGVIPSRKG